MTQEQPIIDVNRLVKQFTLNHSGASSLKTMLLWGGRRRTELFTSLDDVTFQVSRGESVAIVGRNGAGKSTLLSLLARVYKPTKGQIIVRGKMAPLLELGAGFHPDLTGIENVVFNGVILGLTRAQVHERMERIVAFAELEGHIDTPVRTYSSGMLARLGFSIAVHVDAEILIVDEVLAVGDSAFEQKCYAKIEEFRSRGGTIFFVSHNPAAVRRVAERCIWIEAGKVKMDGDVESVLPLYELSALAAR